MSERTYAKSRPRSTASGRSGNRKRPILKPAHALPDKRVREIRQAILEVSRTQSSAFRGIETEPVPVVHITGRSPSNKAQLGRQARDSPRGAEKGRHRANG